MYDCGPMKDNKYGSNEGIHRLKWFTLCYSITVLYVVNKYYNWKSCLVYWIDSMTSVQSHIITNLSYDDAGDK